MQFRQPVHSHSTNYFIRYYLAIYLQKQDRLSLPSLSSSAAQPECTCDKKQHLCLHYNVRIQTYQTNYVGNNELFL